jgi:hypothetical protein
MEKVSELRQTYRACLKLANETDSKKEDLSLRLDAKQALEDLKKICPHDHVLCLRSEYEGSYTDDYDDAHAEDRICLCCGVRESAYQKKYVGDGFKVLTKTPFARFEGGYYDSKGRNPLPDQVVNPLSYLLTECMEIAETKGYHYMGRVRLK